METQNSAETHVGISTNLLETSHMEPDLNRTEQDFFYQNELINQELKKYDGRFNTCSMILFKTWLSIYMILVVFAVQASILGLIPMFQETSVYFQVIRLIIMLNIIMLFGLFYGCTLLWDTLGSKDLFKIEKCIFIFKICVFICLPVTLFELMINFFQNPEGWKATVMSGIIRPIFCGINYVVALYVKRVLLKRDVFKQVSGTPLR